MRSLGSIFIAICIISCGEKDIEQPRNIYCGVENPTTDIGWLRNDLQQYEHPATHMDAFLYTAMYQGNRVFYVDICCPACNVMPPEVKNCDGTVLGRLGDGIDRSELSGMQILWRTVNGICNRD